MTAADAIARSISHTEIVHIPYDAETLAALIASCDDHVTDNEGREDIWGTQDGQEWRVIVGAAE